MTEHITWKPNIDDEPQQEDGSSRHLLVAIEDLLKRSHDHSTVISSKYQSKSLDNLLMNRRFRQEKGRQIAIDDNNCASKAERIELDLSGIEHNESDNDDEFEVQRSRSAPVSPAKIYDKELAGFVENDQQASAVDNFVYNIDLSDDSESVAHHPNSRLAIFFEDDFSSEESNYEPPINLIHSCLNNNCLTITEENEEELEQLKREDDEEQQKQMALAENDENPTMSLDNDDDRTDVYENDEELDASRSNDTNNISFTDLDENDDDDATERLSPICESPSLHSEKDQTVDDETFDKLIVYDIANVPSPAKSIGNTSKPPSCLSRPIEKQRIVSSSYTNSTFEQCPNFTTALSPSRLCGMTTISPREAVPLSFLSENNDENSRSSSLSPKQKTSEMPRPTVFSDRAKPTIDSRTSTTMSKPPEHVKLMKVIQSSSSSLSDFISPIHNSSKQSISTYQTTCNVPRSFTDCSITDHSSSFIHEGGSSFDNLEQKPAFTRRILTNGLLLSYSVNSPAVHREQKSLQSNAKDQSSTEPNSEDKISSESSSSSELVSSSYEKPLSRSDFVLQPEQSVSEQRKASSLKSIPVMSPELPTKILYPIDFNVNNLNRSWHESQSYHKHKVPTCDSGIVLDRHPGSKSNSEDDDNTVTIDTDQIKQYKIKYRDVLSDLTVLKKNIINIEGRLNEAIRELEIEQALIEGEHDLVFKEILGESENDQQKIRNLYKNLQLLIERILTDKNSIRHEIENSQKTLLLMEQDLRGFEQHQESSDGKILKQKETISLARKRHEDLEFQFMELETRCELELEKAEEHLQNEQKLVTQNALNRQNALRDLDNQQHIALHQAIMEKEKLEREKHKLKIAFKQKKIEANELEMKLYDVVSTINSTGRTAYHSTLLDERNASQNRDRHLSLNTKKNDHYRDDVIEMKEKATTKIKLDKLPAVKQPQFYERCDVNAVRVQHERNYADKIPNHNHHVKLRENLRLQERPLTRYLPISSVNFDLRAHIEGAGHLLDCPSIALTATSCRGYLHKMGGVKFRTWNRRWFVFDRQRRSLFYYQDKNEVKLRGCIGFQSIVEVYVDRLQSISLRSPEPREATFIVKTIERPFYLVAPTVELMRMWVDVIITGAEGNAFAGV